VRVESFGPNYHATDEIVLGLGISIDGYVARLNGAVDFLFKDYSMIDFFKDQYPIIVAQPSVRS
jgi:hypothetical protein